MQQGHEHKCSRKLEAGPEAFTLLYSNRPKTDHGPSDDPGALRPIVCEAGFGTSSCHCYDLEYQSPNR